MSKKHESRVAMNLETGKFSAKCKECSYESTPSSAYGPASKAATGHANKK